MTDALSNGLSPPTATATASLYPFKYSRQFRSPPSCPPPPSPIYSLPTPACMFCLLSLDNQAPALPKCAVPEDAMWDFCWFAPNITVPGHCPPFLFSFLTLHVCHAASCSATLTPVRPRRLFLTSYFYRSDVHSQPVCQCVLTSVQCRQSLIAH